MTILTTLKIDEKNEENAKLKAEVEKLHSSQEYYLSTIQELTLYSKIVEDQLKQQATSQDNVNQQRDNTKRDTTKQEQDVKRWESLVRSSEADKQRLQEEVCLIYSNTVHSTNNTNTQHTQDHAGSRRITQDHAGSRRITQDHAGSRRITQDHAASRSVTQHHAASATSRNITQHPQHPTPSQSIHYCPTTHT